MNIADTLVVFDTNILLPPRLSDVVMDLRAEALFSAHWTQDICVEYMRNMQGRFERTEAQATGRLRAFKRRCPEWEVFSSQEDFESVPARVDEKDRHVAAAALALRRSADSDDEDGVKGDDYDVILVSENDKHLAKKDMKELGVRVLRAGPFLDECYAAEPEACERALLQSVSDLKTPPYSREELLHALLQHGANKLVAGLSATWGVTPAPRTSR